MVVTIYHPLVRLFPPTWQHHHLMIASTTAPIIQWQLSLIASEVQYAIANPRLDASLLHLTLGRPLPMPSGKFVVDPQHWRFRAEEARTVCRRDDSRGIADDYAAHCHAL